MSDKTEMQLSRRIPARTKVAKFSWCHEFQIAGPLNEARVRLKMKPFNSCFWCRHEFADDEMTYLAHETKKANRVLCAGCAEQLELK